VENQREAKGTRGCARTERSCIMHYCCFFVERARESASLCIVPEESRNNVRRTVIPARGTHALCAFVRGAIELISAPDERTSIRGAQYPFLRPLLVAEPSLDYDKLCSYHTT